MSLDVLVLRFDPAGRESPDWRSEIDFLRRTTPHFSTAVVGDPDDLRQSLDEFRPAVIHWPEAGRPKEAAAAGLVRAFNGQQVECVLSSSPVDLELADALLEHVGCVVATPCAGPARRAFLEAFYTALAARHSYGTAFERGRAALSGNELGWEDLPRFLNRDPEIAETVPRRSATIRGGRKPLSESAAESLSGAGESFSPVIEPEAGDTPQYPLWFGTDRAPRDPDDFRRGFGSERGGRLLYGTCRVAVPRSHRIGSIGSPWWKRLLRFSDDRLRLDPASLELLTSEEFWRSVAAALLEHAADVKTALVYIHGYNVSLEGAALRAAQLGYDLQLPGVMGFFSWPSKGCFAGYPADEASIQASERYIARFLLEFARQSGAEAVHVIAHSMGNRGLLRALQRILGEVEDAAEIPFGQIILAAPDVDQDVFRDLAGAYRRLARRTTLYVSSRDRAVESSTLVHDAPRVGFVPPVTVVAGVDTVEVTEVDVSLLGHGYYAAARDLLHDIHDLLLENAPPERRMGLRPRKTDADQPYWAIGR